MATTRNIKNIYDFVEQEIKDYKDPKGIELENGWNWSMKRHLRLSYLYLNGQFDEENENRDERPNKNIVLPIINVHYRTEGFDVKDITLYVDNPDEYFKSLLINKFHTKWALKNQIDTFIDEMVTSYCTYGGTLVKNKEEIKPEVVNLRALAFCNQTNILDYPFAIKHVYSPSKLRKVNKKWGKSENGATIDIESLIALVEKEEKKEIEVYEVHGLLPVEWLGENENYDEEESKDVEQIQIISFFKKEGYNQQGVTLFKHKEPKLPFKFLSRDKIEGRALGRGGVEELFEGQIWSNWNEIKITELLSGAAKTLHWTDDPTLKSKNNLSNVENNEILILQQGKQLQQINNFPRNLAIFNDAVIRWQDHLQRTGAASEALLGDTPSAGTPFKLFEAKNLEDKSLHRYRQGHLAVFMDEIYRDWTLPHLAGEITNEQTFMEELSVDEMQQVVDSVMNKKTNQFKINMILALQEVDEEVVNDYREQIKADVLKKGNKRFFKIFKDEMKDISLSVMTNIAGKQKDLALLTDKVVSVLRQYISTPQLRADPEMTKLLNVILESSGLSPIMFGARESRQGIGPTGQERGSTESLAS